MKESVVSSNIEAIDYSKSQRFLKIWFKNGSVYKYNDIDLETYKLLKEATSVGKFYNNVIKGKYRGVKLKEKDVNYNSFRNLFYD